MYANLSALLVGLLLLSVQGSPLALDLAGIGSPDLFICLISYLGMHREIINGAIPMIILGFLADVYAATPTGLHMVVASIIFLLFQLLRMRLVIRGLTSGVVFTAFASLLASLLCWLLASIFLSSYEGSITLLRHALPRALYTAPFAIPILWGMMRIDTWGDAGKKRAPSQISFSALLKKS